MNSATETMKNRYAPDVKTSIVIVTWNVKGFLKQCLQSIYRETENIPFEIIVVDNASIDGTSEMIKEEFPEVRLIKNEKNLGYPKANNLALREIIKEKQSDYVLLLNSDILIQDRAVEKMLSHLEQNPSTGAICPALILPDNRFQTGPAGYLPSALTAMNYFFFFFKLFPKNLKGLFIDQSYFSKRKECVEVDWLSGACLMIRRGTIEKIGLMNEDYYFYAEDLDWGRRMKLKGIRLHYLPWIRVLHYHGVTYDKIHKEINTKWLSMLYSYVKKEKGGIEYSLFRFFSAGGFLLRFIAYAFLSILNKDDFAKRKTREIFHFFIFSLTGEEIHAINSTKEQKK